MYLKRAVLIEGLFVSIFIKKIRAIFCISIFSLFLQLLEREAFQIFGPLLNFQKLEMFIVFPAFPVFLGEKKQENLGEKCSIRTDLKKKRAVLIEGLFV